jgi:Lipocalin-like domain
LGALRGLHLSQPAASRHGVLLFHPHRVGRRLQLTSEGEDLLRYGRKVLGDLAQTFTAEGRVFFILTGEARKPAKSDQERAELLNTLVAYTGTYRIEGDKWITKVEVAWNPEWVGTEQARSLADTTSGFIRSSQIL